MNLKKITSAITAMGIATTMITAVIPATADDTSFVYDFTAFSSANGYAKESLNGSLAGYEGLTGKISELASDSKSYVKLSAGDTATDYIDFTATAVFTLSFTSSHSNMSKGTLVTNTATGEMYTTSSKSDQLIIKNLPAGTYRVTGTPAGDYYDVLKGATTSISKNHAYISTMTITYGEYVASTTAPTQDPNSTPAPTATPGPTTDPSIPSELTIIDYDPWLESAYVAWTNTREVDKYNVYVKKTTDSEYTKIDDELVRRYETYYRADALGLAEGSYTMKVAAVIAGVESDVAETGVLEVKAHNRDGFAHDPKSPNGTASGGYNDDGTPKSDAIILYVDKSNINTITADVIIDSKGKIETRTGLADIMAGRQKGHDKTPLIIRYIGAIPSSAVGDLNGSGYIQVKGCYNVTMEGVGNDTILDGWSFLVRDANNVEIRNFAVKAFKDDGISLDTDNRNIWVHNNDIFYGNNKGGDQEKGDGSCDVKGDSSYVTVSYNHFWDSGKCSLCGMGESVEFFVTYHHNWFDHSDSRHPRIRLGTIHIYNNFFDGNSKYGVGATSGSSAFVEANYFRNCKNPVLASKQGTDAMDEEGTFSGEPGGIIKMYNNAIYGGNPIIDAKDNATSFDAYFADTRDEQVPSTYKTVSGGTTYNNFDTAADMYSYTPDNPANVPAIVEKYSGRFGGGSFKFEFNDEVDDPIYDINTDLETKVKAYTSDVVATYVAANNYPATAPGATVAPNKTPEPTLDPDATLAPTKEPTPTPIPTETPEPTASPTPSPTPDPNATPGPTLAPSSTVTTVGNGVRWNANDIAAGTYTDTVKHNGLDIGASAEVTVEVNENKTTIGTTAYTQRIKVGGKGDTLTGTRCLMFTPDVDCDLIIDGASSNKETARTIVVEQNSAKHEISMLSAGSYTVTGLKANEPVYIYSLSGGWYAYGLAVTPVSEPVNTPAPTNAPEPTTDVVLAYVDGETALEGTNVVPGAPDGTNALEVTDSVNICDIGEVSMKDMIVEVDIRFMTDGAGFLLKSREQQMLVPVFTYKDGYFACQTGATSYTSYFEVTQGEWMHLEIKKLEARPGTHYITAYKYAADGSMSLIGEYEIPNPRSDYQGYRFTQISSGIEFDNAKVTLLTSEPTTPPLTPDATDEPIDTKIIKVEATYDENGRLTAVTTTEIPQSEAGEAVTDGTAKVFYWNSISSMQPYIK